MTEWTWACSQASSIVGVAGVRPRQPDVLADRVLGEERELGELGHLVAQRGHGDPRDVVAIEQNPAPLRVQEAQHEVEHRRLARSDATHQGHRLALSDRERQPVENVLLRRVAEGHVLEHKVAVHVAERDCVRAVLNRRAGIEQLVGRRRVGATD